MISRPSGLVVRISVGVSHNGVRAELKHFLFILQYSWSLQYVRFCLQTTDFLLHNSKNYIQQTLALASLEASASAAMALCNCCGSFTSLLQDGSSIFLMKSVNT